MRLFWDETPVDLFLNYAAIHTEAAMHCREVPFAGELIPVLGPLELTVFKAMFDRTRDWADIEEIAAAGNLDLAAVDEALKTMLGDDDPRFERLEQAVLRAQG